LVEAAWSAVRHPGRLQARYHHLVRRMGGAKNPAARKKAIVAIARTLLKIAYAVLKSGQPYAEPGTDFYARREDPARRQAWLEAQLQKLYPGCAVTVTPHGDGGHLSRAPARQQNRRRRPDGQRKVLHQSPITRSRRRTPASGRRVAAGPPPYKPLSRRLRRRRRLLPPAWRDLIFVSDAGLIAAGSQGRGFGHGRWPGGCG
jgi:hypothetical protein